MEQMNEKIAKLKEIVAGSERMVFFGGAGVSTESGIPDFRSVDGLYHQKYDYPPETILSHTFWERNPEEFYRFYRNKMLCLDAQPNITHFKLAELEKAAEHPFYQGLAQLTRATIEGVQEARALAVVLPRFYR